MRVVGKYIEPTDFALQRWSLRIPYGVPSITKFHSLQSIIIFQQRVHKESLSFRKNERFFFFSRFKLKISFFFLFFFFALTHHIHAIQWALRAKVPIKSSKTAAPYSLYLSIFLATLTSRKRRAVFNSPIKVVVCKEHVTLCRSYSSAVRHSWFFAWVFHFRSLDQLTLVEQRRTRISDGRGTKFKE